MFPVIFGLEGKTLGAPEGTFLQEADPAGIILFKRNIETLDQVRALTGSVRDLLGRDLMVLIDQEGGRVQRLGPPHWRQAPPMGFFGRAHSRAPEVAEKALFLNTCLIARDLAGVGINVDCIPCLDLPVPGSDAIIGDRAMASDPVLAAHLGALVCDALKAAKVLPVIKHIPGHGRATADSHKKLPVVEASLEEMLKTDFVPFRKLHAEPFAMTAHITYSSVDRANPATLSKKVVEEVIRGRIGFRGLLISDDITMKALSGAPRELAEKCLAAGIDLVLHCSGELSEMEEVLKGVKPLPDKNKGFVEKQLASIQGGHAGGGPDMLTEYTRLEQKLKTLGSD